MSIRKYWPITENDVYVRVFDEILSEIDHELLDKKLIQSYQSLNPECRYLLTRTYLRAPKWIRQEQYEKYMAPESVEETCKNLVETHWFVNKPPLNCLIADVASQQELQELAKELGVKKATNMARPKLAELLIQLEKQQAFFNSGRIASKISEALQIPCYLLPSERRRFFFQLEQLFLYPVGPDVMLDRIYLTHMKKQCFYKYEYLTQREAPLFSSRESFSAYAKAREVCVPIEEALAITSSKVSDHLTSDEYLHSIDQGFQDSVQNNHTQAAACYGRAIYNVSQLFMKAHKFIREYEWVRKYLEQSVHKSKRGVTLIRKLLLEIRFLEESCTNGESSWLVSALNTYYDAMSEVSEIEMVDLQRKTTKLLSSIRNTGLQSALSMIKSDSATPSRTKIPVFEVVAVPLKSEANPAGPGTRLSYGEGITVEQLALSHYDRYKGGHYENSMMLTILWLLCYDLLFADKTQFRCAYQSAPLNLQRALDDQKDTIAKRMDAGILRHIVASRQKLAAECGEMRPLIGSINWLIPEPSIVGVVSGLGEPKTRIILERIMSNYRKYASGFPDLTVWDAASPHTKFVEVKSENDTVSDNQQVWMEFLVENGIDVEICKVVPEKKLKRKRGSS